MTKEISSHGTKTLSYDGYDQLLSVALPGAPSMTAAYGYDGLRTTSQGKEGTQYWFTAAYTLAPTAPAKRWHYVNVGDRLVARLTFDNISGSLADALGTAGLVRRIVLRADRHAPKLFVCVLTGAMLALFVVGLRRRSAWRTVPAIAGCYTIMLAMVGCEPEVSRRSLEDGSARLYFHQGVAAGPTLITRDGGAIKEERRFEPFGQPIEGTLDKTVDPMNNLNRETNPDTGWSYHGARWMMPQTARWTAPDPAVKGPDAKKMIEPWGLNPYSYVKQSPTMYWDPDGQQDLMWFPPMMMKEADAALVTRVQMEAARQCESFAAFGTSAAFREGYAEGGAAYGLYLAINQLNPAYHLMVHSYEAGLSFERREYGVGTLHLGGAFLSATALYGTAVGLTGNLTLRLGLSNAGRSLTQDLLSIQRQKGLGDIAAGTRREAEILGQAWVNGRNARRFNLRFGGYGVTDDVRTFRLQWKKDYGMWKANFQENTFIYGRERGIEIKSIHMNITDMKKP